MGLRAYYARIAERIVRHGPHLGLPYTRAMGDGLFEIRLRGREGAARMFYCTPAAGQIVILHGFRKKTERTPARELRTARRRLKEVAHENP